MSEANDVDAPVICGYCKDCKWRIQRGHCGNDDKIHEQDGKTRSDTDDHLEYDYYEGGSFSVGDYFGCVHFQRNEQAELLPET